MNVNPSQSDLKALSRELLLILQNKVDQLDAVTLRCTLKQQKLMVLIQHADDLELDAQRTLATLKHIIRKQTPDWVEELVLEYEDLVVQLYLRIKGESKPYAFHAFDMEPGMLPIPPSVQALPAAQHTGEFAPALADDDDALPDAFAMIKDDDDYLQDYSDPQQHSSDPSEDDRDILSTAVADRPLPYERDPIEAAANDVSERSPRRKRRISPPVILAGLALGLGAIAAGIYAVTRPCVLGQCVPIEEAQILSDEATLQVQDADSAQDVLDAYNQIVEASYMLSRIPPWSQEYQTARSLQERYDEQADVINKVVEAQRHAYEAAQKSQNPPHPVEVWQDIQSLWQNAIVLLSEVPEGSPVYDLAQQKLTEYETNLSMINRQIEAERQAQDQVQSARETAAIAAARTGVADSRNSLQRSQANWQTVIQLLETVDAETMSYAEAQHLLALYRPNLQSVNDRLTQEALSEQAYTTSMEIAAQAQAYENDSQWTQAVEAWRDALNNAQQVMESSTYHPQAQLLSATYEEELYEAQEQAQLAIALRSAYTDLQQLCTGPPVRCSFAIASDRLQVRVAAMPGQFQSSTNRQFLNMSTPSLANLSAYTSDLMHEVKRVGDRSNVFIEFYQVDGDLFGIYVPELEGYVPPNAPNAPEPLSSQPNL